MVWHTETKVSSPFAYLLLSPPRWLSSLSLCRQRKEGCSASRWDRRAPRPDSPAEAPPGEWSSSRRRIWKRRSRSDGAWERIGPSTSSPFSRSSASSSSSSFPMTLPLQVVNRSPPSVTQLLFVPFSSNTQYTWSSFSADLEAFGASGILRQDTKGTYCEIKHRGSPSIHRFLLSWRRILCFSCRIPLPHRSGFRCWEGVGDPQQPGAEGGGAQPEAGRLSAGCSHLSCQVPPRPRGYRRKQRRRGGRGGRRSRFSVIDVISLLLISILFFPIFFFWKIENKWLCYMQCFFLILFLTLRQKGKIIKRIDEIKYYQFNRMGIWLRGVRMGSGTVLQLRAGTNRVTAPKHQIMLHTH